MGHDTHTLHPITERLKQGGDVTKDELHALRLTVSTMPAADQKHLRDAIDEYVEKKKTMLAENVETEGALLSLRQALKTEPGTMETLGKNAGTTIGQVGDTLTKDAQALSYRQWNALQDPANNTTTKVIRVLGIAAAGYGLYRAAKWALGKPKDSFWGKTFKVLGVTAVAGFLLHSLAPNPAQAESTEPTPEAVPLIEEKKPDAAKEKPKPIPAPAEPAKKPEPKTVKSPVAAPSAVKKAKPEVKTGGLLDIFPENTNLIDGKPSDIIVNGKKHFIAFRRDCILIDGLKYSMKKSGYEVDFDSIERSGSTLSIKGSAMVFGFKKSGTTALPEAELKLVLEQLLVKGTYENKTESLVISRF